MPGSFTRERPEWVEKLLDLIGQCVHMLALCFAVCKLAKWCTHAQIAASSDDPQIFLASIAVIASCAADLEKVEIKLQQQQVSILCL